VVLVVSVHIFGCVGHVIWFEFDLWICCLSFADFNGMSILHVEGHYVEFLVQQGLLPTCFSSRGIRPHVSMTNVSLNEATKDATEHLVEVVKGVERSITSLDNAVTSLMDAENDTADRMQDLGKKVDR